MTISLPLHAYEIFRASDPEYVRTTVSHMFVPHNMSLTRSTTRIDARLHSRRLLDTALTFITYGGNVLTSSGPFNTFFTVCVPLSGTTGFQSANTDLLLTRDLGLVISPADDDLSVYWQHQSALLTLRVERSALEAHLSGLLGQNLPEPLRFQPAMPQDRADGKALSAWIRALARDLDRRRPIYNHRLTAHSFEQSMMSEILLAQRHNYSPQLESDVTPTGSRELRHAIGLLESHPEWPLSLANVAHALGVSGRSLQRRFQYELGTTFRGVLHFMRLRRVHDVLVHSEPDAATVTDVITSWGLPLEGYTIAAYQRKYGETPAETLRR